MFSVSIGLRKYVVLTSQWLGNFFAQTSMLLLAVPMLALAEPYTLSQIQAERLELADLNFGNRETRFKEIDRRIKIAEGDAPRVAGLYLLKAHSSMHLGHSKIEENLAKALPLIDKEQQPELYLLAMSLKAYGLYIYQDRAAEAVELLEQVQQHPALNNDFFVQVDSLSNLLEAYYETRQYDKISKPLFQMVKAFSADDIEPVYLEHLDELNEELAYHSARIGDIDQAISLYKESVTRHEQNQDKENIAIVYCNIANMYFLPLAEKFQYAKASLQAMGNLACSDVMEKLVLLEEVQQGKIANIARLAEFNPSQQMPTLNERSAYYAGLAYLQLNDLAGVQNMLDRMTDPNNWERYDLLQQLAAKQGNYQSAFAASQKYHQLRAQKDADARKLLLASYQTRLELAQEDTKAAEAARQAEQLAAAEQKAQARLSLMLTVLAAALLVVSVFSWFLWRSRQLQLQLQQLSETDPLTGLLNRRAFLQQVQQLTLLAHRQQFPLSIAVLDLDFFKQINDQHGHQTGDEVLKAFADAAKATLRQTDIIGRFGGEEFILATTQQNPETVAALLQRLQQSFQHLCLEDKQIGFRVTFSAGIAAVNTSAPNSLSTIEAAIHKADQQLYKAKANGRQQVCSSELCLVF